MTAINLLFLALSLLLLLSTGEGRYSSGYNAHTALRCQRAETRYANTYSCIDRPDNLVCWTLLRVLERGECRQPCNEKSAQSCVGSGQSCASVDDLCPVAQKCCLTG